MPSTIFSRATRLSAPDARWVLTSALPPTFLLPIRARYFNSTTQIVDGDGLSESLHARNLPGSPSASEQPRSDLSSSIPTAFDPSKQSSTGQLLQPQSPSLTHSPTHESLRTLLPLLKAQQSHYITAHIHARPYLLTVGDALRLPFHMPGVVPGDILRLNRASIIGSRDYTLKGAPYLDERLFECRARVMSVESEPMRFEKKTKQRQRRVKTVKSKHRYTVLRLAELKIKSLDEAGI